MKNILIVILGIVIIIFSNTIFNFIPFSPKPDLLLIYVIVLSLYWKKDNYSLFIVLGVLGFFLDSSIGKFQGQNTILFLVIALFGIWLKDKIRKDFLAVPFFLSVSIIIFSAFYNSIIAFLGKISNGFAISFVNNFIYIILNSITIFIVLYMMNFFKRIYGRYR